MEGCKIAAFSRPYCLYRGWYLSGAKPAALRDPKTPRKVAFYDEQRVLRTFLIIKQNVSKQTKQTKLNC